MTLQTTDRALRGAAGAAPSRLPRYLTTEELADVFHARPETVRSWRVHGRGPRWIRVGRRVLYAEADVQLFIEQQEAAAS
jgi:hypothetical protein